MFDNIADLIDKIRLGEDSYLELKEVRFAGQKVSAPHKDSLADELAAFANKLARNTQLRRAIDKAFHGNRRQAPAGRHLVTVGFGQTPQLLGKTHLGRNPLNLLA